MKTKPNESLRNRLIRAGRLSPFFKARPTPLRKDSSGVWRVCPYDELTSHGLTSQ